MISRLCYSMHVRIMTCFLLFFSKASCLESCATVAMHCNLLYARALQFIVRACADSLCDACVHHCSLNSPGTLCNFCTLYAQCTAFHPLSWFFANSAFICRTCIRIRPLLTAPVSLHHILVVLHSPCGLLRRSSLHS